MSKESSYNVLHMIGAGKCTLCRSEGSNKSTCPLNPAAHGGNPTKHPLAMVANNVEPDGREKNTISISEIVPKKSSVALQQVSLSQTSASDQLRQLPVVESIILNMYNMDDVNSFCSSTKEIQKTCKKLFNKEAIEQEIKKEKEILKRSYAHLPVARATAIVSHIKSLMKITNPDGLDLLKSVITTFTAQSMKDVYRHIYVAGLNQNKEETYTNKELHVPLAFKKSIKILMLKPDIAEDRLKTEMIWCSSTELGDISYSRVIDASNGMYVSVGDVLEAFFKNTREIYIRIQEEHEYCPLGNHIYAGLKEICPGVYDMIVERM